MKFIAILAILVFPSLSIATSLKYSGINDIIKAECSNAKGGVFNLDTETRRVTASFAGINNLTNGHEGSDDLFVEVIEEYPNDKYDALGTLASNRDRFGNTSLLFKKDAALFSNQKSQAFFMDKYGNNEMEEMDCLLTFKTSNL